MDSMPGGGAEILSDRVRQQLCPNKATADEWLEVARTAHKMGIRSNASMLYGHIETMEERGELKESQKRIRELEAALANALMDRYLEQAFLEIACEKLQTTPEELKKKSGLTRSDVLGRKADAKR